MIAISLKLLECGLAGSEQPTQGMNPILGDGSNEIYVIDVRERVS